MLEMENKSKKKINKKKVDVIVTGHLAPIVSQEGKQAIGELQNTVLTETTLIHDRPEHIGLSSIDDKKEAGGRIDDKQQDEMDKNEIDKAKSKLHDDLKKLKEELSILKQERMKENQRRLVRESGVPKVCEYSCQSYKLRQLMMFYSI